MAVKNIQLKNTTGDILNPKTYSRNVLDEFTGLPVYDTLRSINNSGWVEATLLNGTTPLSAGNSIAFKKIGPLVCLSGTVKKGTSDHIFTLPKGYIPRQVCRFGYTHNNGYGIATIETNGQVKLVGLTALDWGAIDAISFAL